MGGGVGVGKTSAAAGGESRATAAARGAGVASSSGASVTGGEGEDSAGAIVATVGVSFNAQTRRRFATLRPPPDAAYLSDLTVLVAERGSGLGEAMLAAAEAFAARLHNRSIG